MTAAPVITNSGSGSFGDIDSWTLTETATPLAANDMSASIGDLTLNVRRTDDTELVVGNDLTLTHDLGKSMAHVNTVRTTGPSQATLTADSALFPLLSGRLDLPGIESGLPAAAFDMVSQAIGNKRQVGPNINDHYWSLAGHSVGFAADSTIIQPTASDDSLISTNIVALGGMGPNVETVLFQHIRDFCSIENLTAAGYPRKVTGDTVPLAREKAYVKFTVMPSSANATTTFELLFGPTYRRYGNSAIANPSKLSITFTTGGGSTGTIITQGPTGTTATVTAGASSITLLDRTQPYTVTIEVAQVAGAISLSWLIESSAGAAGPYSATSATLAYPSTILYSKQWTITQDSNGGGVRDLVTRYGNATSISSVAGVNYTAAPIIQNQLSQSHGGSPLAPFNGEIWEYIKNISAARRFELAATHQGIVAREPRLYSIPVGSRASASITVSDAATARNVAITNKNTAVLAGTAAEAFKAESIYSVDVNETKTISIRVDDGIRFIWSPRPWYNSKATNDITMPFPSQVDGYAELEGGLASRYYVTGADGFPVNPMLWTTYGGRVTAKLYNGVASITLTGPREAIPGIKGPFRIGESDTGTDHSVLRIMGVGVVTNPIVVNLPSGAAASQTRVDAAATVVNPAIGTLGEVLNAASWIAQRVAGPTITLTMVVPMRDSPGLGRSAGSLVTWAGNIFRIDSAVYSDGIITLTGSRLTALSDTPAKGRTLAQFAADHGALTCGDYSIKALALPTT